jgi:hypothetical protein
MASNVLVVANRTASTPMLMDEVARRARAGARCTLLVPPESRGEHADWTLQDAQRLLSKAAGAEVECLDCGSDALDTIHQAVDAGRFDAIIVSTVPEHLARWVHHDLPHRLEHLGLPVTVIPHDRDVPDDLREGLPSGWDYPPIEAF